MKKRYVLLFAILALWIGISAFFYFQNKVTVKTMMVPGWQIDQNGPQVQIKEIRLINKEAKPFLFDENEKDIRHSIIKLSWMPYQLKEPLLRIISFYSLSYDKTNAWYLEVSGIYLNPDKGDTSHQPEIGIKVNGVDKGIRGGGTLYQDNSNFMFFTTRADMVEPDIQSLEVRWQWKGDTGTQVFGKDFKTTAYVFTSIPREYDDFDPEKAIVTALRRYLRDGNQTGFFEDKAWEQKLEFIQPYTETMSTEASTNYIGKYKGYEHVFSVKMNYIFNPDNSVNQHFDGTQTFYAVEEKGAWRIIEISDFVNV